MRETIAELQRQGKRVCYILPGGELEDVPQLNEPGAHLDCLAFGSRHDVARWLNELVDSMREKHPDMTREHGWVISMWAHRDSEMGFMVLLVAHQTDEVLIGPMPNAEHAFLLGERWHIEQLAQQVAFEAKLLLGET